MRGVLGRPFLSLDALLDLSALPAVHEEVCVALASLPLDYTGGSHRSMGIMPPELAHTAGVDYGEVIASLDAQQFERFRSLADDPSLIDRARRGEQKVGEEQDVMLSRRQMLWLEFRHGVYFPWKVYLELLPNRWWSEKHSAEGKRFTRHAEATMPKTLAFVRSLPFAQVGRCNVMGLRANDHGTVHRDGDPAQQSEPDHFITFCPSPGKRLYLYDRETAERTAVAGRAYWFNDNDDHGVEADPFFRYSIRVDGIFEEDFLRRLRDHAAALTKEGRDSGERRQ